MFRNVPECTMFHVPDFIDGRTEGNDLSANLYLASFGADLLSDTKNYKVVDKSRNMENSGTLNQALADLRSIQLFWIAWQLLIDVW